MILHKKIDGAAQTLAKIIPEILFYMSRLIEGTPPPDPTLLPPHFRVVHLLARYSEPVNMTELAAALGVTKGTLTSSVKKLVSRKYVLRRRSTEDDRVVLLTLIQEGQKLIKIHDDILKKALAKILTNLSHEEQCSFVEGHRAFATLFRNTYERIDRRFETKSRGVI